jgi:plasmid stability protein
MATMTIKNVPAVLHEQLKRHAYRHHRSLNREAIACLERAIRQAFLEPDRVLARARRMRQRTEAVFLTDAQLAQAKQAGRA